MATKYAIKKSTFMTTNWKYEVGGCFAPSDLLMQPLLSAIDDDVYYALTKGAEGSFFVEYEVDKQQQGFKIRKIYPNFVPSSVGLNDVNTFGGSVYMQINRKHLVTYLLESKTVIVLNLITGEIDQNIDLSAISNNNEIDFVGYDDEGKWLIYRKSDAIFRYGISAKSEFSVKTFTSTTSLSYGSSYAYVPKSSIVLYDSARRIIISTVNFATLNSATSSSFLRWVTGTRLYSLSTNGVVGEKSFNTNSASEERVVNQIGNYNSSGSYYYYASYVTRGTMLGTFDEKKGIYSSTTSFCANRYNYSYLPNGTGSYGTGTYQEATAATVILNYSREGVYKQKVYSSTGTPNNAGNFYGGTHMLILGSNKDKVIAFMNKSWANTTNYNVNTLTEGNSPIVTLQEVNSSSFITGYTEIDSFTIFSNQKIASTELIDVKFSEIEAWGRQLMYTRNDSDFLLTTYIAGLQGGYSTLYNIVGVSTPTSDTTYPASGNNLDVYESRHINKFKIGNPLNGKLRILGFDSSKALYHDYYETLNSDLYLWYDSNKFINVSLYNRTEDTVKSIKTTLLYDAASYAYDVGIARDGSKIVLIRHVMATAKSIEYYVTNKDMTEFQTAYYTQSQYTSTKPVANPEYWNRSCHVLVTDIGVAGMTSINGTTPANTGMYVYHRGTDNYGYTRAYLVFDSNQEVLTPSLCSIYASSNPVSTWSRNSVIDALYVENKYKLKEKPTYGVVAGFSTASTVPDVIRNVPVINGVGTSSSIDVTLKVVHNASVWARLGFSNYYNTYDKTYTYTKRMGMRQYSVVVRGETHTLFEDHTDNAGSSSFQQSDIRFSGITILNEDRNYYLLKGTIYGQNPHLTNNQPLNDEMNFVFHKHATGTTVYYGIGMEADPFDVAANKIRYTNLGGTSADTGVQIYSYLAPPVQLSLDSKYPNKETFYVPDNVNYALKILDTDNTGGALTSLKMSINGTEIVNKTTGLKVNEVINFLVDLPNLYDTNRLNDGLNSVQFRLDAGGDVTFLDVPLYKGKRYKLDAIPDIIPTTVITKAHIKAYNGQDELVPVSGVKTQSSSGEVEYVYHYSKDYASSIRDLILQMDATKSAGDTVEIKKIIAVFEGGDN
ncbi:hypothetical protein MKY95_10235 [Paenibacillus sp. FSL P4-0176]|uniref:hypothetical protein n=1 Tax=Paenibacillus sp. FSL P4-0176 TaxID=2921631 RepID=UPI0030D41149